jgi:hypothetical protein
MFSRGIRMFPYDAEEFRAKSFSRAVRISYLSSL